MLTAYYNCEKMEVITDTVIVLVIQILITFSYLIFVKIIYSIMETYNQEFNIILAVLLLWCLVFGPVYIAKNFADGIEGANSMKH